MRFTPCFTPLILLAAPPILAWLLRRWSFWRRARGAWLTMSLWMLSLLPLCATFTIAAATWAQQRQPMPVLVPADVPYAEAINHAAMRHGLEPVLLAALVDVESSFDARAVSPVGAMGLAQLMPATAIEVGVAAPFDAAANLDGGARYLATLIRRYRRVDLALAAYNAGPARVDACDCLPGNAEYVHQVRLLRDYYTLRALLPPGARITDDNRRPTAWKGIDYTLGCNAPVVAPISGRAVGIGFDDFVGSFGSNNSYLILEAGNGDQLIFLHGRYTVVAGDRISRGQVIGREASVGNSTGCHTDLSLRRNES